MYKLLLVALLSVGTYSMSHGQGTDYSFLSELEQFYQDNDTLSNSWKSEIVKEVHYFSKNIQELKVNEYFGAESLKFQDGSEKDSAEVADAYKDLGDFYARQIVRAGEQEREKIRQRALQLYRKSWNTYKTYLPENHPDISIVVNRIGRYYKSVNVDSCLFYYDKVLKMRSTFEPTDYRLLGAIYNNIGNVYWQELDFETAYEYFLKGIEILKPHYEFDSPNITNKILNLMLVCADLGYYSEAIEYGKLILPHLTHRREMCLNNLGIAYLRTNNIDLAIFTFHQAEEIIEPDFIELLALVQGNLGQAYAEKRNFELAENYYKKSNDLLQRMYGEYDYEYLTGLLVYADLLANKKEYLKAEKLYQEAILNCKTQFGPEKIQTIRLQLEFIEFMVERELYANALEKIDELQKNYHKVIETSNPNTLYSLNESKVKCLLKMRTESSSNKKEIEETFDKIDRLLTSKRYKLYNALDQISFNETLVQFFDLKVEYFADQCRIESSIENLGQLHDAIENAKSNALFIHSTGYQSLEDIITDETLKDRFSKLKSTIRQLRRDIMYESDSSTYMAMKFQISEKTHETESFIDSLQFKSPENFPFLNFSQRKSLVQVQSELLPDELLLNYYITSNSIKVLSFNKDTIMFSSFEIDSTWQTQFQFVMDYTTEPNYSKELLQNFIKASYYVQQKLLPSYLANHKQISKLIIVPDNTLEQFPFDVLLTKETSQKSSFKELPFLINKYNISYRYISESSTKDYENVYSKKYYGGFAPTYKASNLDSTNTAFYDLSFSRNQMLENLNHVDGKVYIEDNCSKNNIIQHANDFKIMHLSSHTQIEQEDKNKYRIILSEKDNVNETLTLDEVMNLDLENPLVILSSCNTGVGKFIKGEGAMHLSRAFSFAGARSVLMSFWNLSDQQSAVINKNFLSHIVQGKTKDLALQKAKLQYIASSSERLAHPYFWAGLAIIGDTNHIKFTKGENRYRFLFAALLIIAAIFSSYKYFKCIKDTNS